ncbi:hypothetical protein LRS06_18160 [Hymenobacter sp. J193]|uniref:hypothetical protein n=1 Tax=Hymenobacter sp. J193 TaxID=2898429 RepID=UPI002151BF5D|nr:hypothetical protein [Hymenobacter sp. J193]MCR5889662.1 hypothetical protein [Hymenobacter sp. J193]
MALLADLLRATDRQTEENSRKIDELRTEIRQTAADTNARFEAIFDRFATAVADGFIRVEKKIDAVKQEVAELRTDVQHIDQRLERIETNPATTPDVLRRLEILESIVLRKAS